MAGLSGVVEGNVSSMESRLHGLFYFCGAMVYSTISTRQIAFVTSFDRDKTTGMKILQITRQYLPSTGGLESAVEGLSQAVKAAGHEVRIVTLKKIFITGK